MSTLKNFTIKKALLNDFKLRLSLGGTSGSGKTYTALMLAQLMGGKTCVIDTERKSASKYAKEFARMGFEYDVIELDDFHPNNFIAAIQQIETAGYDTIIIDSTTHEWAGKGGCLELHDQFTRADRAGNGYAAWAKVTPLHTAFIDAIIGSSCHVIATVRSKSDYVQEKGENGKTQIRKVGLASVQRDGMDYEYDIMLEIDTDHVATVAKTRCSALNEKVFRLTSGGTGELATIVKQWLSSGAPVEKVGVETAERILEILQGSEVAERQNEVLTYHGCRARDVYAMTIEQGKKMIAILEDCAAITKIIAKMGWQKRLSDGLKAFGTESLFLTPAEKVAALRVKIEAAYKAEQSSAKAQRLEDTFACGKDLAVKVLEACKEFQLAGGTEVEWREVLKTHGAESRKNLTAEQALAFCAEMDELTVAMAQHQAAKAEENGESEDSE